MSSYIVESAQFQNGYLFATNNHAYKSADLTIIERHFYRDVCDGALRVLQLGRVVLSVCQFQRCSG